jgi:hypothetical protein
MEPLYWGAEIARSSEIKVRTASVGDEFLS